MEAESGGSAAAFGAEASARENKLLWPRQWLVVGREDELPEPAHYFTWERTGVPLLILRGSDGEIRGFYNSCRHRGAPVVREARGRNRALRCQYHSWTYDTLGRLVSVPDERDFVDLRLEERSLVPIRVLAAGGWLFALEPGADTAAPTSPPRQSDRFRTIHTMSLTAACDWKVAASRLADLALEGAGDEGDPIGLNGRVAASDDFAVGLFAWPTSPTTCEIQAIVSAPDWGEEDSPADAPEWQARFARLTRAVERAAGTASQEQAGIDRDGPQSASAGTRAICEAVGRLTDGS